jgi:predicted DNA-binding transcriptional regulator AlpA
MTAEHNIPRLLRRGEVEKIVGLKRTAIEEAMERGEFPLPVYPTASGRARRWLEDEIKAHQEARIAARDAVKKNRR